MEIRPTIASVVGDYGTDYGYRFLDEKGALRVDLVFRLWAATTRLVAAQMSLSDLEAICDGWIPLVIALMAEDGGEYEIGEMDHSM
jgi:hypothetical protein